MHLERWAAMQGQRKPDGSSRRPAAGMVSMALLSATTLLPRRHSVLIVAVLAGLATTAAGQEAIVTELETCQVKTIVVLA